MSGEVSRNGRCLLEARLSSERSNWTWSSPTWVGVGLSVRGVWGRPPSGAVVYIQQLWFGVLFCLAILLIFSKLSIEVYLVEPYEITDI